MTFYAVAASLMRRILVDHARGRTANKRGGGARKITFDEDQAQNAASVVDVLALDEALDRLHELDPRKTRIIELRFFAGLTVEETAKVLEVSAPTITNDTRLARAWLHGEINR